MIPLGEEVRHGKGIHSDAVTPQAAGGDKEIQIGAQRQTDAGPARIGQTGPIGKAGQAHQQIAGHIRGLGAERRHPRTKAAAAEEVCLRVLIGAAGKDDADDDHRQHIQGHGQQMLQICSIHRETPLLTIDT